MLHAKKEEVIYGRERKKYEKVLKQINKNELIEFLLENIILDSKLENRFQMRFTKYFSKKTKVDIKEMFKQEWLKVSDRGYISEEMGFQAMHILYDYTHSINKLIEKCNIEESIKYVEAVLEGIGEFQIDGSYGEHTDIIDTFKEIMKNIIEKAQKEEYDSFIIWLKQYMEIKDELYDFKYEFKDFVNKKYLFGTNTL